MSGIDSQFIVYEGGLVCQKPSLSGSSQVFIPKALRQAALYNSHHRIPAGHPGTRQIYNNLQRQHSGRIWSQTSTPT